MFQTETLAWPHFNMHPSSHPVLPPLHIFSVTDGTAQSRKENYLGKKLDFIAIEHLWRDQQWLLEGTQPRFNLDEELHQCQPSRRLEKASLEKASKSRQCPKIALYSAHFSCNSLFSTRWNWRRQGAGKERGEQKIRIFSAQNVLQTVLYISLH